MAGSLTYKDLTERVIQLERENAALKNAGDANAVHLSFLENMEKINQVIQQATDIEEMMSDFLQVILEIFDTDRSWLLFPCDPDTKSWSIPMERTRPEHPGAFEQGVEIMTLPEISEVFRLALDTRDIICIDYRYSEIGSETAKRFNIKTQMHTAVYPQIGKPWLFGIHQCSIYRTWTDEEKNLFREISHRLGDALNTMLFLRDLRESENKLYIILNASPDNAFLLAPDGTLNLVNDAAAKSYGFPKEKLVGTNLYDLGNYNVVKRSRLLLDSALKSKKPSRWETEHNGRYYDISVYPIFRDGGSANQYALFARDITENKRAVEEKLELERQVRHTQKLKSLGDLAGGIAHDFNNLLTTILGNADLALQKVSAMSPVRKNLREIVNASRRAAELSKQMLAYSGRGQFVIEPIDGNELIKEMTHLLEVSISKKAVLKFNLSEPLPSFNGDVTQIRQIIMNLITNASEAIGDKNGYISLSTGSMYCDEPYLAELSETMGAGFEEPLPEGIYVYMEVADTGCGMDSATIEKIVDPFFTTKFTGRGLGMSAVLGIVRGHKGALKIYSEVGKGTTFRVFFPTTGDSNVIQDLHRKEESEWKDWKGDGTILLADDEDTVLMVGKEMLEHMGFKVLIASNGEEALSLFREHSDDIVCILLDLSMPKMDGEEAFREIRRFQKGAKVVLCSGYNELDATQRFAGKGLAGFIQKPFTFTALRKKISEILPELNKKEN
jgi:PAS domain S-box-containing protein